MIYVFLADGFEEIEALGPVDIFRRAGMDVTTVSIKKEKTVTSSHRVTVVADAMFDELDFQGDFLIYLPGGMPGTTHLEAHQGLQQLLTLQYEKGQKIAAICAAPSILGNKGLLEGREAICYPGFEDKLKGAKVSSQTIVKAANIFTAKAAGVAIPFALKLVEELKGAEAAQKVKNSIHLD